MTGLRSSTRTRLRAGAALLMLGIAAAAVVIALGRSANQHSHRVESIFQDDQHLLYSPTGTVARTLDTLRSLGVDRIRLTIEWFYLAPMNTSPTRPAGFDATNPASYPAGAWAPYDRVVELARAKGLAVDFNLTAPGPLWAMARPAPNAKSAIHYRPSATEFGAFVLAVGRRYSGTYAAPGGSPGGATLPRVSFWTIWNEPNQPGWLAPQRGTVAGKPTLVSPALYRGYVDAAFTALKRAGHVPGPDTILIGELAPEGSESTAFDAPIPPLPFVRALYCVDSGYRPLTGSAAAEVGCPPGGDRSAFVSAHPGLFGASGFAHHPYSFFLAPNAHLSDPNFAALADLSRLEHGLDSILAAYGQHRRLPLYLTEYGYETNPPNPYRGVSLRLQSRFIDQAQYMAWKDARVRALAQFLLYDSAPDPRYPPGSFKYWSTFQTGLLFQTGAHKPAFAAYRLPIFIPNPVFRAGDPVLVWGMLRPAPPSTPQVARIQWRGLNGVFRTLQTLAANSGDGTLNARIRPPGAGAVRIEWTSPGGRVFHSRAARVSVG